MYFFPVLLSSIYRSSSAIINMSALIKALVDCFLGPKDSHDTIQTGSYDKILLPNTYEKEEDRLASEILHILYTAEKPGQDVKLQIDRVVHPNSRSWYEGLAKRVLDRLVEGLKSGVVMGAAMKEAFDKASAAAEKFVHEHPVFAAALLTVVAIGILVLLVPWVVEALGFGELGPIEG